MESEWSYEKSRFIISGCLFLLGYILHRKFSFSEHKRVGIAVYANGQEDISGIHEKIGSFPDFIHVDIVDSTFASNAIEAKTYRHFGHSRADPGKYRPDEEVAAWIERDPIPMYRNRLIEFGFAESVVDGVDADIMAQVDEATEAAKASPEPAISELETEMWADGGSAWRN